MAKQTLVVAKPPRFFRGEDEGGDWPAQAVLALVRPPGYDELSDSELAGMVQAAIDQREQHFRAKYDAEGRAFLGRRRVLEQSRHAQPRSREPRAASREPRAASRSLGPGRVSQQVAAHRAPAGQQALARRLPSSHGRLV